MALKFRKLSVYSPRFEDPLRLQPNHLLRLTESLYHYYIRGLSQHYIDGLQWYMRVAQFRGSEHELDR